VIRQPFRDGVDERRGGEGEKHYHRPLHLHLVADPVIEKGLEYLDPGDGDQGVDDDELQGGEVDLAEPVVAERLALLLGLDELHITADGHQDQHLGYQYEVHQGQHPSDEVHVVNVHDIDTQGIKLHGELHHQQGHADQNGHIKGEHHQPAAIEHEVETAHENS
jgi:hypothetical protein